MSFTNSTEHFGLPQWVGSDTPTFLVDFNNAFLAIDNAIYARITNARNLQNQINSAVDTITVLQERIEAFDTDFGDLPEEVAGLKTQVQILSVHEREHDVDIKAIREEIENIQTTASNLSRTMTEMFRTRDESLATYKEQMNSDLEEIRGDIAENSGDFALLKNGLYEGEPTEGNPLGERKFALKSEIPEYSGLKIINSTSTEGINVVWRSGNGILKLECNSLSPGCYIFYGALLSADISNISSTVVITTENLNDVIGISTITGGNDIRSDMGARFTGFFYVKDTFTGNVIVAYGDNYITSANIALYVNKILS